MLFTISGCRSRSSVYLCHHHITSIRNLYMIQDQECISRSTCAMKTFSRKVRAKPGPEASARHQGLAPISTALTSTSTSTAVASPTPNATIATYRRQPLCLTGPIPCAAPSRHALLLILTSSSTLADRLPSSKPAAWTSPQTSSHSTQFYLPACLVRPSGAGRGREYHLHTCPHSHYWIHMLVHVWASDQRLYFIIPSTYNQPMSKLEV
jgi:hypothetical protein